MRYLSENTNQLVILEAAIIEGDGGEIWPETVGINKEQLRIIKTYRNSTFTVPGSHA